METHWIDWPAGAKYARLRIGVGGIRPDTVVRLAAETGPQGTEAARVLRCVADGAAPLNFQVEVSEDGATWLAWDSSHATRAA